MRKQFNLKVPRFDPFKNVFIGIDSITKICTKCGKDKPLSYETYCKDSQREYGFKSQCRQCGKDYYKNYKEIK